ncbi:hypothetical protein [Bacillus sp. MRMR6]|uniref:hypothetical protein n=1 Tax=Bacillus sp. MRMR6 TaxID=1928617 RepID=UPI000952ED37|nr:hypothetical protein [Bacillus sp. MRMR6]OLS35402.1 hypothetical protein BTR25_19585 [Bacillus sp. MRMR6]
MGIICPGCSGIVNGTIDDATVVFIDNQISEQGTITFTGNLCSASPELSTLTITFLDIGGSPANRSFTFTATSFTGIFCSPQPSGTCTMFVNGFGEFAGDNNQWSFHVELGDGNDINPDYGAFEISNFAFQAITSTPVLATGSIEIDCLN